MISLRSLVYHLIHSLSLVPWGLALLAFAPLPRSARYGLALRWLRLQLWVLRRLVGIEHQVIGARNLPDEPVILLSKHQSTWETYFYPVYMPRELCYVFKRELLYLPFFGWGIWLLDMIHIDRRRGANAFEAVVQQGSARLAQGRWIIMFPEGTRTPVGARRRYKTGGARLASRTGVRVVPIALNSGNLWPRRSFKLLPGTITVSIGPPIETTGKSPDLINDEVERWIEAEMRRLNPERYASLPKEPQPA